MYPLSERDHCTSFMLPSGEKDAYLRFLLDNRGCVFHLKPWNGNSGDLLIWRGTEHLLRRLRIRVTLDPRMAQIILIPGGNQTMWQGNIDIWNEVRRKYPDKGFVVGPGTIRMGDTPWVQDIGRPGARVLALFSRDPESYACLRAARLDPSIVTGLSHDPALYLRDSPWIRRHRAVATEEYVLAAFRFDKEGLTRRMQRTKRWLKLLPPCLFCRIERRLMRWSLNRKLSLVAKVVPSERRVKICDASVCQFEYYVELIRSAAEVHTDRLHCMLLAAMLGKKVFAYPTAYGKLESVYAHSLRTWADVVFPAGFDDAVVMEGAEPADRLEEARSGQITNPGLPRASGREKPAVKGTTPVGKPVWPGLAATPPAQRLRRSGLW
jgi:exopolysaccharide biosynthesis predicted pyruvyltransferase EpsI